MAPQADVEWVEGEFEATADTLDASANKRKSGGEAAGSYTIVLRQGCHRRRQFAREARSKGGRAMVGVTTGTTAVSLK